MLGSTTAPLAAMGNLLAFFRANAGHTPQIPVELGLVTAIAAHELAVSPGEGSGPAAILARILQWSHCYSSGAQRHGPSAKRPRGAPLYTTEKQTHDRNEP